MNQVSSAAGLVTGPERQDTWQGSTAFRIEHWSLQTFVFEEGVLRGPSLNSALLVREL